MVDAKGLFVAFLLAALVIVAMINFGVLIAVENDVDSTILENDAINKTFNKLVQNLSEQQDISQTQREGFEEEIPTQEFNLLFSSIIAAGKTFTSSLSMISNIFFALIVPIFGLGTGNGLVAIGTFSAIIILVVLLVLWRLYKQGQ